ncbi:tetratricopeptide repeat protein [Pseudooceanicola sp.]|uniref:tetratricopeptide repeat protein n=1 Tax=Pseudooceanicola sp. TaxID=1914328 RepID=UPI00261002F8|nr:tetratricopeptide repeat protein [Pseudooceanicola sp.]MDF1856229.1 tetratricopeptide repeat protein [Pseudooceanicola sp.]
MAKIHLAILVSFGLAACSSGGFSPVGDQVYAPGVKPNAKAVDGLIVGDRLMAAKEYELALQAYTRAAGDQGMNVEVLSALGAANYSLGRLGQAEKQLRAAIKTGEAAPEAWNNLGILLMEKGETAEAVQILKRAYALDNGESDAIRDNLRLALEKLENSSYAVDNQDQEYKVVRRGSSEFLIRQIP